MRRSARFALSMGIVLPLGMSAVDAGRAQEPSQLSAKEQASLRWSAPAGCLSRRELWLKVVEILGEQPTGQVQLWGEARRTAWGVSVVLSTRVGERAMGERQLELRGSDCREHDEAIAVVVALLLEKREQAERQEPVPVRTSAAPPGASSQIELGASAQSGAAPGWLLGPKLVFRRRVWSRSRASAWIGLAGAWYVPRTFDGVVALRVTSAELGIDACLSGNRRLSWWLCGGPAWSLNRASAVGGVDPRRVLAGGWEGRAFVGASYALATRVGVSLFVGASGTGRVEQYGFLNQQGVFSLLYETKVVRSRVALNAFLQF